MQKSMGLLTMCMAVRYTCDGVPSFAGELAQMLRPLAAAI